MIELDQIFNCLGIVYEKVEHPPVYTIEDVQKLDLKLDGVGCKNLFLTDHKNYYLYILEGGRQANLKSLARTLGVSRLSFASVDDLYNILHLKQGSVTPFGIMNDSKNQVLVILDLSLKYQKLLFHPLVNTATIAINCNDLIRFLDFEKHSYIFV